VRRSELAAASPTWAGDDTDGPVAVDELGMLNVGLPW
jgi:hypothetical protein